MEHLAKAATVGALAMNGGAGGGGGGGGATENSNFQPPPKIDELHLEPAGPPTELVPECPAPGLPEYHKESYCQMDGYRSVAHHQTQRRMLYEGLLAGGTGATLVPNQQTVFCPHNVQQLDNDSAVKGFDTTWLVENTATTPVVVSWVVDGKEYSPFHPDTSPAQDDPEAILQPNEWKAVPAFDSFVYNVRELTKENTPGQVLLQHRVGLIPIGNPNSVACDASLPDVEPINPLTAERQPEFRRTPTPKVRRCNILDVGFRNQVGCPLHVYWAGIITPEQVPTSGFSCGEKFKFHLGTKPATQDFMHDWESATKFEGSFVGHTFVARLASDPSVVIDSYTVQPTRVVDCPSRNPQLVSVGGKLEAGEAQAQGNVMPVDEQEEGATTEAEDAAMAAAAGMGHIPHDQPLPDIGGGITSTDGGMPGRGGEL